MSFNLSTDTKLESYLSSLPFCHGQVAIEVVGVVFFCSSSSIQGERICFGAFFALRYAL